LAGNIDLFNNFAPKSAIKGKFKTFFNGAPYHLGANTTWLFPNTTRKPLDDKQFRRALAYSINMKQIIDIQLAGLTKRLEERKIHVVLTDAAKDELVREAYDPVYGARPLKRSIQRRVLDPLALRVLEGAFGEGDTISVDRGSGGLQFVKREAVRA